MSLQSAYKLPSSTAGAGETVAIVDAYDQPNAASDLATYRSVYGLPTLGTCGSSSPCFRKVNESGGTSYPRANSGWGLEIDLDIEMVSAICPYCNILLVEASSNSWTDLGTAATYAATAAGVVAVSNSYGGSEGSGETSTDLYYNHPGVAVTASSGDGGYGVEYPAASQYVVAVGGTTLNTASNTTRGWTESAWSGAGSGCSAYEPKPTWQTDSGCARRTVADVSAVADPNTGVAVYDDYGSYSGGWYVVGGTSVASPIIASTYALAGTPAAGSYPASYLYADPAGLNDVTSGSNGSCGGSYLCTAVAGYDGPTGLGTPNGTGAFTSSASTTDFSINASPGSLTVAQGSSGSSTITITASGTAQTVTLSATGVPSGVTATFSPTSITGSGTSTLTLTASTSAATATNSITITGTGTTQHTTTVSLTVTASTAPLTITTTSLPAGHLNKYYSATIQATGGASPYSWTIALGSLPFGLAFSTLNGNGTISGTPTVTGTFTFTVQVSDSTAQTASRSFSIKILRK